MNDDTTTWPTLAAQEAAKTRGCTCVQLTLRSHLEPAEWEQDPICSVHGDRNYMRAMIDQLLAGDPR